MNKENKTEIIQVPITPKDRGLAEKAAAAKDLATAAWVRKLIRDALYGK